MRDGDKLLVAVPACHFYNYGAHENWFHWNRQGARIHAVRETWWRDFEKFENVTCKFFYGRGAMRQPQPDEVFLECPDTYEGLPEKVRAICSWALGNGFAWLFKCDDDTYVYADRLLESGFEKFDQMGYKPRGEERCVTGGPGYTLSTLAMHAIGREIPWGHAEDLWVGATLRKHGYTRQGDPRFLPGFHAHYVDLDTLPAHHDFIGLHAVTAEGMRKYMPKILLALESCGKYRQRRDAQRKTWLKFMPDGLQYRFFIGMQDGAKITIPQTDEADVTTLPCPDNYEELILKTRAMVCWALEKNFDFVFKTDDDTYVDATKLLASDFEGHEYSGWSRQRDYAQGGSGYWLGRRAMELLSRDFVPTPETRAEDAHVGKVLARYGIYPVHDGRYLVGPAPAPDCLLPGLQRHDA